MQLWLRIPILLNLIPEAELAREVKQPNEVSGRGEIWNLPGDKTANGVAGEANLTQ